MKRQTKLLMPHVFLAWPENVSAPYAVFCVTLKCAPRPPNTKRTLGSCNNNNDKKYLWQLK